MSTQTSPGSVDAYRCPYCRMTAPLTDRATCRTCGSPAKVHALVSDSGWEELPGAADMAQIQFGRSHVQITGTFVPVADFNLHPGDRIWFSHHKLTFAESSVKLANYKDGKSFLTRLLAKMENFQLQATGPGHVALSDNHLGEIVSLPLDKGKSMWVRSHTFLAATDSVTYSPTANNLFLSVRNGNETETEYPIGRYADVFYAPNEQGLLLLHSPGNTMFRDLKPHETVYVKPDALLYRDLTVSTFLTAEYPHAQFSIFDGIFGNNYANRNLWLKLNGPGRVAISSKYEKEFNPPHPIIDGTVEFLRW
ncbi:AIM24 family protein [Pseudolysobacter antarcticus]|uniref:AIM24 family protein n=1 Tax=Pseudolysobacter antarcticus TaxID=2511995 RepID=A0A411HK19_9GAMM|nr:AIM24 family protein [Pseudolysobacter antarcticus]QBB70865.1 AIM24 family protein [Pseudolysobacter antarcticus]